MRVYLPIFYILVFGCCVKAQIPKDSVGYSYFEKERIETVKETRKKIFNKNATPWDFFKIGRAYEAVNIEDSAHMQFITALELFSKKNDTLGLLFTYAELHNLKKSQNNITFNNEDYLIKIKSLTSANKNKTFEAYLYLVNAIDFLDKKKYEQSLRVLYNSKAKITQSDSLYLKWKYLNLLSINHKNLNNKDSSFFYYNKSLLFAKKYKLKNPLFYSYLNFGNLYLKQNQPKLAITYYDSAELNPPNKHKLKLYKLLYKQKAKALEKDNQTVKSLTYLKTHNALDSLINEKEQNIAIYKVDSQYKNKEITKEINLLQKAIKNLQHYKWYYILGLLITLMLAIYSIVRWKKSDLKKKNLEEEKLSLKQEHQIKIKKLKQLVLVEQLELKNKSRIQLKELMYIKVDGHYLEFYTTTKKEFIRGKLSEIETQLPPNFLRSHRSYIVNVNYINRVYTNALSLNNQTEIPVSRKYKSLFNSL